MISFSFWVVLLNLFTIVNKSAFSIILFLQKENKRFYRFIALIIGLQLPVFVINLLIFFGYDGFGAFMVLCNLSSVSIFIVLIALLHETIRVKLSLRNPYISSFLISVYGYYLVLFTVYLFLPVDEKQQFINANFSIGSHYLFDLVDVGIHVVVVLCLILIIRFLTVISKHKNLFMNPTMYKKRVTFGKRVSYIFLFGSILIMVGSFYWGIEVNDLIWMPVVSNIMVFYILYLVIDLKLTVGNKPIIEYSGLFENLRLIEENSTNESSLAEQIKIVMQQDRPYLQESYTITDLAKTLKSNTSAVSSVINKEFEMSFPQLITTYRIEELQKRLVASEYSHMSIDGISKSCGFKSRSAMYTQFKKHTGLTPTEFVKNGQETIQ